MRLQNDDGRDLGVGCNQTNKEEVVLEDRIVPDKSFSRMCHTVSNLSLSTMMSI